MSALIWAVVVALIFAISTWFFLNVAFKNCSLIRLIFVVAFVLHISSAFLIHYTNFYPFGGGEGDQDLYHAAAVSIARDFREGVVTLGEIKEHLETYHGTHGYPVILGVLYAITTPERIVGMMMSAWFSAISVILVYLIALQISGSPKGSFFAGMAAALYPSLLYFGSLLLKDTVVVPVILLGLLCMIKIVQRFSWKYIILFVFVLLPALQFRFYMAVALLWTFSLSWPFLMGIDWRKKIRYGIFVLIPIGFIPQMFGYGYYASGVILQYTNPEKIELYREHVYTRQILEPDKNDESSDPSPVSPVSPISPKEPESPVLIKTEEPSVEPSSPSIVSPPRKGGGPGSTVIVETGDTAVSFILNYLLSFSFVSLGPFPWHMRYARQYLALLETIPWCVIFFFIVWGTIRERRRWRVFLPVILFDVGLFSMLALLLASNFGVYMRIRMPAFLVLLTLLAFPFAKISLTQLYENTRNWGGRIYRILPRR